MLKRIREVIRERIETYRNYAKMTDLYSVLRRYFVIGYFDGVLTILGMIVGAHLSGEASSNIVISAGIATALALGISSGFGAYEAEIVEQSIQKKETEKAMLAPVGGMIESAYKFATYVSALIHGIAPIPAALVPLIPYAFLPLDMAFYMSVSIGFASLFIIGLILGRISKMNVISSGVKFVLAGFITLIVILILNPSR